MQKIWNDSAKVEVHVNSKFSMDGDSFLGRFASLDDFYKGPEALIGVPNPKVKEGAEREHTTRGNAETEFTTSYNVTTTPKLEWEFVNEPKADKQYPHEKSPYSPGCCLPLKSCF